MNTSTIDGQSPLLVDQNSAEQVFWCEAISLASKQEFPPTNDAPCQCETGDCNGNPDCSHGCA